MGGENIAMAASGRPLFGLEDVRSDGHQERRHLGSHAGKRLAGIHGPNRNRSTTLHLQYSDVGRQRHVEQCRHTGGEILTLRRTSEQHGAVFPLLNSSRYCRGISLWGIARQGLVLRHPHPRGTVPAKPTRKRRETRTSQGERVSVAAERLPQLCGRRHDLVGYAAEGAVPLLRHRQHVVDGHFT